MLTAHATTARSGAAVVRAGGTPRSRLRRIALVLSMCVLIGEALSACVPSMPIAVATPSSAVSTANSASPRVPEPSNSVDQKRLDALSQDPLLKGGRATPAKAADHPGDGHDLDRGGVGAFAFLGARTDPFPLNTAQQLMATAKSVGWVVVGVECVVDPSGTSARIYAVKRFDDFSAAAILQINPRMMAIAAYVPFHSEKPDPWIPHESQSTTTTCLDGPDVPKDTTVALMTNIGAYADV